LYSERLHLLVDEDSSIYSITNLKGKDVWLGPDQSGSRKLAFEVLRAAGFDDSEIYLMDYCGVCSLQEALADLSSGRVSAVFRTTSVPNQNRAGRKTSLQDCTANLGTLAHAMCLDPEVRLLGLDENLLQSLTQNPRYSKNLIPRNVYPNQNYAVATIGVQALFVTTMPREDPRVKVLYSLLNAKRAIIEKSIGSRLDLLSEKLDGVVADELSSHVHDQVRDKLLISSKAILLRRLAIMFIIVPVIWLLLRPGAASKRYEARVRFAVCLVSLILLWLALGYALYRTEGPFSVDYSNPWDASWSVLTHYSHGLQTPTMTAAGREIAFLGLGVFVLFVGWLRSALIDDFLDRAAIGVGRICSGAQGWISGLLGLRIKAVFPLVTQPRALFRRGIASTFHRYGPSSEGAAITRNTDTDAMRTVDRLPVRDVERRPAQAVPGEMADRGTTVFIWIAGALLAVAMTMTVFAH
jgi:hypothetical protein